MVCLTTRVFITREFRIYFLGILVGILSQQEFRPYNTDIPGQRLSKTRTNETIENGLVFTPQGQISLHWYHVTALVKPAQDLFWIIEPQLTSYNSKLNRRDWTWLVLKASFFSITVIISYTSTRICEEFVMDKFYDKLTELIKSMTRQNLLIIAEADNERVGGTFGFKDNCKQGQRLMEFSLLHILVMPTLCSSTSHCIGLPGVPRLNRCNHNWTTLLHLFDGKLYYQLWGARPPLKFPPENLPQITTSHLTFSPYVELCIQEILPGNTRIVYESRKLPVRKYPLAEFPPHENLSASKNLTQEKCHNVSHWKVLKLVQII